MSESLPVARLLEMSAPYNPRKIAPAELERLRASIRTFGVVRPIVVNRRSERIVGGHQTVKAAELEGYRDLPVLYVDLDEHGERQLNLALNKISGEWDDEKLRDLLGTLQLEGADMPLTGFSDDELAKLLEQESPPDDFPFPGEETEHECPKCGYTW